MPPDFLLPLFALTLLANAVLVAVAIRTMRRADPDRDQLIGTRRQTPPATPRPGPTVSLEQQPPIVAGSPAVVDPGTSIAPPPSAPTPDVAATRAAQLEREPAPKHPPVPGPTHDAADDPAPEPPAGQKRRRLTTGGPTARASRSATDRGRAMNDAAVGGEAGAPSTSEPRPRGRRRFSLPPLDDDHDKVSQSIKTFLAGVEAPSPDQPSDTPRATSAGATTVALVAVAGLRDEETSDQAGGRRASADTVGGPAATDAAEALAMVERTLRGAARGTDVVTVDGRGRYRIVLPGTGELAARAYLRRIRASIEPLLEAADGPLRLAVATATVLDEPIDDAVDRVERRLAAALDHAGAAGASGATGAAGTLGAAGSIGRAPRAAAD